MVVVANGVPPFSAEYHLIPVPFATKFATLAIEQKVCVAVPVGAGVEQVGLGAQVILAIQPALVEEASLLKLKVKQPSGLVEVNGPGIVVPQ